MNNKSFLFRLKATKEEGYSDEMECFFFILFSIK